MNYKLSFVEKVTLVYYIITFDYATVNYKLGSSVSIFLKIGRSHLPYNSIMLQRGMYVAILIAPPLL